jgi:S1-C subfamily serine protease
MRLRPLAFLPPLALALSAHTSRADEGMWPFNMVPTADIAQKHGVTLTSAWLDHVRLSSVRFNNGGSGSFVSSSGLVLTNHHVAGDCLSKVSTPEHDWMEQAYLAGKDGPEIKCPDLELNQLVAIEDVTDRVTAAKTPGMSDADANLAIKGAIATIEKACHDATGNRCDVVNLYAGGKYNLYTYKRYTDVRVVFAPEHAIAFFGGDPDNFTYPRFDLDMALFRIYENGQPVHPKDFLAWSAAGPKDGDVAFVSGHPGRTNRNYTLSQLDTYRDATFPFYLDRLGRERTLLRDFAATSAEAKRETGEDLDSIENGLKAIRGEEEGLRDPALMNTKRASEAALRKGIGADPGLKDAYGSTFDEVEKAQKTFRSIFTRYMALEGYLSSDLLDLARVLVRMPAERALPNDKRLPEFRESGMESLRLRLFSPAPVYGGVEVARVRAWLEDLERALGPKDPIVQSLLGGRLPARVAEELVSGTKLTDVYARRALEAGGQAAVDASQDPVVVLLRTIDPEARAVRKRYDDEVEAPMRTQGQRIAQAIFALKGTSVPPDATFTLRLSVGLVKGYTEGGKPIPWDTDFTGLYAHATGKPPLELPKSWTAAKSSLTLATPFNFVSTDDIVGGNSGSPVVNAAGELIGLIFDGNLPSLPNRFVYQETTARAVSVTSNGMLEALRKVYGASDLARELASP